MLTIVLVPASSVVASIIDIHKSNTFPIPPSSRKSTFFKQYHSFPDTPVINLHARLTHDQGSQSTYSNKVGPLAQRHPSPRYFGFDPILTIHCLSQLK